MVCPETRDPRLAKAERRNHSIHSLGHRIISRHVFLCAAYSYDKIYTTTSTACCKYDGNHRVQRCGPARDWISNSQNSKPTSESLPVLYWKLKRHEGEAAESAFPGIHTYVCTRCIADKSIEHRYSYTRYSKQYLVYIPQPRAGTETYSIIFYTMYSYTSIIVRVQVSVLMKIYLYMYKKPQRRAESETLTICFVPVHDIIVFSYFLFLVYQTVFMKVCTIRNVHQ